MRKFRGASYDFVRPRFTLNGGDQPSKNANSEFSLLIVQTTKLSDSGEMYCLSRYSLLQPKYNSSILQIVPNRDDNYRSVFSQFVTDRIVACMFQSNGIDDNVWLVLVDIITKRNRRFLLAPPTTDNESEPIAAYQEIATDPYLNVIYFTWESMLLRDGTVRKRAVFDQVRYEIPMVPVQHVLKSRSWHSISIPFGRAVDSCCSHLHFDPPAVVVYQSHPAINPLVDVLPIVFDRALGTWRRIDFAEWLHSLRMSSPVMDALRMYGRLSPPNEQGNCGCMECPMKYLGNMCPGKDCQFYFTSNHGILQYYTNPPSLKRRAAEVVNSFSKSNAEVRKFTRIDMFDGLEDSQAGANATGAANSSTEESDPSSEFDSTDQFYSDDQTDSSNQADLIDQSGSSEQSGSIDQAESSDKYVSSDEYDSSDHSDTSDESQSTDELDSINNDDSQSTD